MKFRKLAGNIMICLCILTVLGKVCFAYHVLGYSSCYLEDCLKENLSDEIDEDVDIDVSDSKSGNAQENSGIFSENNNPDEENEGIETGIDLDENSETDDDEKVREGGSEILMDEESAEDQIISDKTEPDPSTSSDNENSVNEGIENDNAINDDISVESKTPDELTVTEPEERVKDSVDSTETESMDPLLYGTTEQFCGDNMTWSYSNGVLTISGSEDMYDYSEYDEVPWIQYLEGIKKVIIEDGVTSIGKSAFSKCINLTDVSIPDSMTRIGECAFSECSALKEIELPTHMEAIEYRTFYMCTSLSRVTVKKDIKNHVHTPYVISGIDSTCTERGYTDATVCIDCGATIENSKPIAAKGHNWGRWVTTRAATVQQQGLMERTCTVCGEKESSVIARMHPVSIENAVVTGINEMTYTGTALKPSPTVSVRGEILKAGTDYTVTYSNNVDAGKNTAIIIITGKGNYTGTKRIPFTISRATQSITGLSASYTKTYGDKAFTLGAKAKTKLSFKSSKSTVVVVDTEGKVTIKGAGKATITVTAAATGNYNVATKTVTVTVSKASQSITGLKGTYKKTFGNKAFPLGAKAKTKRTYKTSNKMVATVDKKGQVTIKGAGTAKITITAAASANYKAAKKTVTLTVAKAAATVKVTASKKALTLSSAKLAQKNLVVNPKITCSSKGSRSYKNVSTNKAAKKLKVNKKTGKITVPKNTAKGTYSVKIKVTVKEKGNFKKTIKTLTVKVIVK